MQVAPITSAVLRPHAAHDLAALKRGNLTPTEQRAAVASQFEAILLRQFLQDSVGSMMGGSDKSSGNVYGYMLTDTLAQKLTEGGGMGLAPIIAKQLTPRGTPVDGAATGSTKTMSTTDPIPATWQKIAECLRAELADYGALFALFEEQQKCIFAHSANEVLRLAGAIEAQARAVHDIRRFREGIVASFATANGRPATATLRSLLPLVEAAARPLLEALIGEVNHLLHRVRRISRHNHSLLGRTVELHQETLRLARPDAFTQTYAPNGRVTLGTVAATPALLAAG